MAFWSPKQHPEDLQNQKFRSGGAHKSSQTPQSKIKNAGTNRFKINNKNLSQHREGIFLLSNHLFTS
jgi:hypothetical protein